MIPTITTWSELEPAGGNVLLIVNSPSADSEAVALAWGELERYAGTSAMYVIAPPSWRQWFAERGVPEAHTKWSVDEHGEGLELNYFLESPGCFIWTAAGKFRLIAGTAAHSLHNDEVKDIFEQRVSLLMGTAQLAAHTLPQPYLAVLDLAALVTRLGRQGKVDEYAKRCRSFVDDLHATWKATGSPTVADGVLAPGTLDLLARHFGHGIFRWNEAGVASTAFPDERAGLETLARHFQRVLLSHDELLARSEAARAHLQQRHAETVAGLQAERTEAVGSRDALLATLQAERTEAIAVRDGMLRDLQAERTEAIAIRDGMLRDLQTERTDAVTTRDETIADLQRQIEFLTRGWRRWVVKRR